ncbi:MAG: hypothetical protein U0931_37205 [Vulcanimicrobiota bacterium]
MTQRLQQMLELLATDRIEPEQFWLELDRLEHHYSQNLEVLGSLSFSADEAEGLLLREQLRLQTENIVEALDCMRDFAESGELDWAERSLGIAEESETVLAEIRAALEDEMVRNQGLGIFA